MQSWTHAAVPRLICATLLAFQASAQTDTDADGVPDPMDVCVAVADPAQCDSDADGYGNACDCDFDQNGVCNLLDFGTFGASFGSTGFGRTDSDCDARVDLQDFATFAAGFRSAPGPSGLACAGTAPCPAPGLVFPGSSWAAATPASVGVDAAALQDAIDYLEQISGSELASEAMVIRGGYAIWQGPEVDARHNVWSITKTFTSTAMGLLLGGGRAHFATRVADHVAALGASYPDVTLRHFTTHGSGYDAVGGAGSSTPFQPALPLFAPPGSWFLYWDAALNELANVLTQIAGEPLADLFAREVAGPIGMPVADWSWGHFGTQGGLLVNGGAGNNGKGVQVTARSLARLCHLFLARGRWNGQQIVPSEWVGNAVTNQVQSSIPNGVPGTLGPGVYGHGWFVNDALEGGDLLWPDAPRGAYMAAGFNQNRCWVIPDWSMVVVRTGTTGGSYTLGEENEFLRRVGLAIQ